MVKPLDLHTAQIVFFPDGRRPEKGNPGSYCTVNSKQTRLLRGQGVGVSIAIRVIFDRLYLSVCASSATATQLGNWHY